MFRTLVIAAAVLVGTASVNDPLFPQQWALTGIHGIHPDAEWPGILPEKPIVIALIDSGVDLRHPDLAGAFWQNPGEIPGNGIDDDQNGYIDDECGWNFLESTNKITPDHHGTYVAGILAADTNNKIGIAGTAGMRGMVQLMVLQVLQENAGGSVSDILAALRYAWDNGADLINLSLGVTGSNAILEQALARSAIPVIRSAGNQGRAIPVSPGELVLTVANLQADGSLHATSNYGVGVDLAAPGTEILTTESGGGYRSCTGTSMAAPMVTAAAARLLARAPTLTPTQLCMLLRESTVDGALNLHRACKLLNAKAGQKRVIVSARPVFFAYPA